MADTTQGTEELEAEQALFEGRIQGLVASFRSDQRPLQGLAGLLDWRFHGAISKGIKQGFLTGKQGECVYLPVTRAGRTYHLILVGVGTASSSSENGALSTETVRALKKNISALKLERIGVSRGDLGKATISGLKGATVCVVR